MMARTFDHLHHPHTNQFLDSMMAETVMPRILSSRLKVYESITTYQVVQNKYMHIITDSTRNKYNVVHVCILSLCPAKLSRVNKIT